MNQKYLFILLAIICFIVSIGGIFLLIFSKKKEKKEGNKASMSTLMLILGVIFTFGGFSIGCIQLYNSTDYDKNGNKIERK